VTLAELEALVQQHVLCGGAAPATLAKRTTAPTIGGWSVYISAYRARLVDALAQQFPTLAAYLGAPRFAEYAQIYVSESPSRVRSLRDYGHGLPKLLASIANDADARRFAELAQFEWWLAETFDAAEGNPIDIDAIATVAPTAWPQLTFRFVPHVQRRTTVTNAVALWRALRDDAPPPPAVEHAPVEWLLHRDGLETSFRSLDPTEADALDRIGAGASFGQLCEHLGLDDPDGAALTAASFLRGWLEAGLLERTDAHR